jgi:hypothetical protein
MSSTSLRTGSGKKPLLDKDTHEKGDDHGRIKPSRMLLARISSSVRPSSGFRVMTHPLDAAHFIIAAPGPAC